MHSLGISSPGKSFLGIIKEGLNHANLKHSSKTPIFTSHAIYFFNVSRWMCGMENGCDWTGLSSIPGFKSIPTGDHFAQQLTNVVVVPHNLQHQSSHI